MNIMISANSNYLSCTYIMLYSLIVNHKEERIDIYLIYEDLKETEIEELQLWVEKLPGMARLIPLYVGSEFKQNVTSKNGIQIETYYRILGIDLLPMELERILYLDVDMVIKRNLSGLYGMDLSGAPFAVCEDIFGIINGFHEANKRRLKIPEGNTYFNAGVMLFHLEYLRETHATEKIIRKIYENYERYEYNDQDVLNEMYYDKAIYTGWDEYNCPPAWYYLDKKALSAGNLKFADYSQISGFAGQGGYWIENYQNITRQIYQNAKIIHYLGDTKPWSKTRKAGRIYQVFDQAYKEYARQIVKNS